MRYPVTTGVVARFSGKNSSGELSQTGIFRLEGEMGRFLTGIVGAVEGKKTAIGGSLVILGSVVAVFYGKLDVTTGLALAGAGFTALGISDRMNRHHAQVLSAIQGVAQAGVDYRAGNKAKAIEDVKSAAAPLEEWIQQDAVVALDGQQVLTPTNVGPLTFTSSTGVVSPGAVTVTKGSAK